MVELYLRQQTLKKWKEQLNGTPALQKQYAISIFVYMYTFSHM